VGEVKEKNAEAKRPVRSVSRPIWPSDYEVGGDEYQKTGLKALTDSARQRFFFILAAEEILDALVGQDT
jgi:hypothetical protein